MEPIGRPKGWAESHLEGQSGKEQRVGKRQVEDVDVGGCFHLCVSEEKNTH